MHWKLRYGQNSQFTIYMPMWLMVLDEDYYATAVGGLILLQHLDNRYSRLGVFDITLKYPFTDKLTLTRSLYRTVLLFDPHGQKM